jgi:hypothetical protein
MTYDWGVETVRQFHKERVPKGCREYTLSHTPVLSGSVSIFVKRDVSIESLSDTVSDGKLYGDDGCIYGEINCVTGLIKLNLPSEWKDVDIAVNYDYTMEKIVTNQAACCGCMLNPGWMFPVVPMPEFWAPPKMFQTPHPGLTQDEQEVLHLLRLAWDKFVALGSHREHDLTEYNYAIHLAQQKMAVRVARRVDGEIWAQP